jgi:subtilisin family serine protease
MKKISKVILVCFLVGILAFPALAAPATNGSDAVRKIVVFQDGISKKDQSDALKKAGLKEVKKLSLVNAAVVMVDPAIEAFLLTQPEVLRVDNDPLAYTQKAGKSVPTAFVETLPWGVDQIDADLVWAQMANRGEGIKVALLDTGINLKHPDLVDNIYGGYNAIDPRKAPVDTYGHGTHVAGIIAGVDNEIGVIGVAPRANLYAVKVLDVNSGYISDVIDGLQWCIDNQMQVINMSVGLLEDVESFHEAITKAYEQGIVLIAASGNSGENSVIYPAKYSEVIAVGASDFNNQIPYWSSQGPEVDIVAPGLDIYSTFLGVTYRELIGTSMACPHVAGTAALILSSGISDSNGNGRVNDEVRERLLSTATDLGETGWDSSSGWGLVNAARAVGIPTL